MSDENKIIIFDTTLRDGEQSPGYTMTVDEKILVAKMLEQLNVDVIEAGFAIASKGDFEAISKISEIVQNTIICSLARAKNIDIEAAGKSIAKAKKKRIHTFISTSDLHIEYQLKTTHDEVLRAITQSVSYARKFTDDVEWSCMDATRSNLDFLYKSIETAIAAGATTVNIPDTVGYALPNEFGALIGKIRNNVVNIDRAIISVHCQNDLGLATANSLASLSYGAKQIECTINGIGERAGNTSLEEVVMAIKTRKDLLEYETDIVTNQLVNASKLVSRITGTTVQNNKAIVGVNAFAHESGIHQDGMLKHPNMYEIMNPSDVGWTETNIILGKHSGRNAFAMKLKELSISLEETEFDNVFTQFKALCDNKKNIYDDDILSLISQNANLQESYVSLVSLNVEISYPSKEYVANIRVKIDNEEHSYTSNGCGTIDALFKALAQIHSETLTLDLYQVKGVTGDTDAQAEVTLKLLDMNQNIFVANTCDSDTILSSAKAYIHCLNKVINLKLSDR